LGFDEYGRDRSGPVLERTLSLPERGVRPSCRGFGLELAFAAAKPFDFGERLAFLA
jgi:hypothetical protein